MRMRSLIAALAFIGAASAPGLASAYTLAYAAPGTNNMRAGPGTQYPVVAQVLGGSQVNIVGCLSTRNWCDVIVQNYRGWMSTTRLQFPYGGQLVYGPQYYGYASVPVVGFGFSYWQAHYYNRPWFGYWYDWHPNDRPPGWSGGSNGGWDGGTGTGGGGGGGNNGGWHGGSGGGGGGGNGGNGGNGGWAGGSGGGGGGGGGNGNGNGGGWSGGSGGGGDVVIERPRRRGNGNGGNGGGGNGGNGWDGGGNGGGGGRGNRGGNVICEPGMPC